MSEKPSKINKQLKKTLVDIGLTDEESRVYLTALSLGPDTVAHISKKSALPRTTTYDIIKSLCLKGLMFIDMGRIKKTYVAEPPAKLRNMLEDNLRKIDDVLPNLNAISGFSYNDASFKYYEGIDNVKLQYESILKQVKANDEYFVLSDQEKLMQFDEVFFHNFFEKRARLGIEAKLLLQHSSVSLCMKEHQKNFNCEVKILPEDVKLSTNLVITPHCVMIHQLTYPVFAIVIENKNIIHMHQESFKIMWRMCK